MIEESETYDGGACDAAVISLVGSAFDEGRRGRAAQEILARGRQLRRRKRAMPALAALGVVAASVSLTAALSGRSGTGTRDAGSGHFVTVNGAAVNVDEAGFSIHTDAKSGEVTVTLRQLFDESELQVLLAKAGVPTAFHDITLPAGTPVTPHAACTWTGARVLDPASVISNLHRTEAVITIYPSKMPAGSVLGLIYTTSEEDKSETTSVGTTLLSGQPTGCVAP